MARIAGHVPRRGADGIAPVITYERPSRASRALVLVSALAVLTLAAWVVTPIALTRYPSAISLLRDLVAESGFSELWSQPAPTTAERGPRESRDLVIDRPAEQHNPPTPAETPKPVLAAPQLEDPPATTLASAPVDPAPAPATESVAAVPLAGLTPAGLMPWPTAEPLFTASTESPVAEEPSTTPVDTSFGPVPLPPRRPAAAALARLGIPLPRPRPSVAEPPAAEMESIPDNERLLFDRLSAPN